VSQQETELRYRGRSFYSQQYAETEAHRVNPTSALLASALRAAINLERLITRIDTKFEKKTVTSFIIILLYAANRFLKARKLFVSFRDSSWSLCGFSLI